MYFGNVAWSHPCLPKNRGSLGTKDCYSWNTTAIGLYVSQIAKKADLMWIKWVHILDIEDSNSREYQTPKKQVGVGEYLESKG